MEKTRPEEAEGTEEPLAPREGLRVRDSVLVSSLPIGNAAKEDATGGGEQESPRGRGRPEQPKTAAPPSRGPGKEMAKLNALLSEHESKARKTKTQLANLQKKCEQSEAETARMRSELRGVRDELEKVQKQSNSEASQAKQRETELREELSDSREETSVWIASAMRGRRIWQSATSAIGVIAIATVLWLYLRMPGPDTRPAEIKTVQAKTMQATTEIPPPAVPEPPPKPDFTNAVARLDEALKRARAGDPEKVLRRIQKEYAAHGDSVCAFEWNGGQPSLLFGVSGGSAAPSLELEPAVAKCADAVEKLTPPR